MAGTGRVSPPSPIVFDHGLLSERKACLHILNSEARIHREQLGEIGVIGKLF